MDLNKLAIETITSNYLKKYLISINHKFSYKEQLTIIYNSDLTLENKNRIYIEYIENCNDNLIRDIAKMLIERNNYILNELINIKRSSSLIFNDPVSLNVLCVNSIDILKNYLKMNNILVDTLDVTLCNPNTAEISAYVTLNKDMEPLSYDLLLNNIELGIEDTYINIPHNLRIGDRVRVSEDNTNQIYRVAYINYIEENQRKKYSYCIDSSISVIKEDDSSDSDWKHIHITYIEKI